MQLSAVAFPLENSTPKEMRPSAFPVHNNMPHFQLALTKSLLKIIMNQGRRFDFDTGDTIFIIVDFFTKLFALYVQINIQDSRFLFICIKLKR